MYFCYLLFVYGCNDALFLCRLVKLLVGAVDPSYDEQVSFQKLDLSYAQYDGS